MNFKTKLTLAAILFIALNSSAAGIDDILNYKPSTKETKNAILPYSTQEIIAKIPALLNSEKIYDGSVPAFKNDSQFTSYNELNFGKCSQLYITNPSYGGTFIASILKFSFSKNESIKEDASKRIKNALASIQDPRGDLSGYSECRDKQIEKITKLKDLANAIITAAPSIIQEKSKQIDSTKLDTEKAGIQRTSADEKADKRRKDMEQRSVKAESDIAAARLQAEADARDAPARRAEEKNQEIIRAQERQKNEVQEKQRKEQQLAKANACFESTSFKLYRIANYLVGAKTKKIDAKRSIDNEQNAAKISGYVDKSKMYEYGKIINNSDNYIKEGFPEYKKLGGKAENINDVQLLTNPCENLW